jgi:hypothetical protein
MYSTTCGLRRGLPLAKKLLKKLLHEEEFQQFAAAIAT